MTTTLIERRENGVEIYCLRNECLEARVMTLGACLMGLTARDRSGVSRDVVLGYDTVEEYGERDGYLGFVVGRVANRIAGAVFTLNGVRYELPKNDGENCLHGGPRGLSARYFTAHASEEGLKLSCTIPDMEDGFPGTLDFSVTYSLEGDRLVLRYEAVSDKDTAVNFTNHAYFNLSGTPENIENHLLTLRCERFCPVDSGVLATGEHRPVEGTPFDFRIETRLGDRLSREDEQLRLGGGIDHSFVLAGDSDQATLYHPGTGLELTVSTDLPEMQVYTANMLTNRPGKNGAVMGKRSGICFETQFEPNSVNSQDPSPMVLRAGKRFESVTSFRLAVRK